MNSQTDANQDTDGDTPDSDADTSAQDVRTGDNCEADTDQQTANLIEGYHVIAEWIRFADAKAAVVLTLGGALASLVIPTLKAFLSEDPNRHLVDWWPILVCTLFAIWLFLLLLSGVWSFLCILPFRRKGRHPALGHCSHFIPQRFRQRSNWKTQKSSRQNVTQWAIVACAKR